MGAETVVTISIHPLLTPPAATPGAPDDGVRIETTTLLPGGALATLTARPGAGGFVVSDDGAGRMALLALGVQDLNRGDTRRGKEIAEARGIDFGAEGFSASEVSADQLTAAVAYVADACRAWVEGALESRAFRTQRDLTERATEYLRVVLPGLIIDRDRELLGVSTKRHRFDLVVTLPGDRLAMFEALTPAPVSMASVHFKFHDLMQAHGDWPREAVVEDLSAWTSQDLAAMQQVSSHVRGIDGSWADLASLAA